jgi:hypothetical protein
MEGSVGRINRSRLGGFKTKLVAAGAALAMMTGTAMAAGVTGVLVAGGQSQSGTFLKTAEVYNLGTGTFTPTGSMNYAHVYGTITKLLDGTVLVAGGDNAAGSTKNAEIFNPATGTWTPVGSLNVSRDNDTAVLLLSIDPTINGQVLVCGGTTYNSGTGDETYLNSCEVYNPTTHSFSLVIYPMKEYRAGFTSNELLDDSVLLAGGTESGDVHAEVFTPNPLLGPVFGTFTIVGPMKEYREFATGTNLLGLFDPHDGQVLITGGDNAGFGGPLTVSDTAERYNPSSHTFTYTAGNMHSAREFDTANELPALFFPDEVLVTGGIDNTGDSVITADLYSSGSDTFTLTAGDLSSGGLAQQTAVTLPFGPFALRQDVLIAGGGVLSSGGTVQTVVDTSLYYSHFTTDFSPRGIMNNKRIAALGAYVTQ